MELFWFFLNIDVTNVLRSYQSSRKSQSLRRLKWQEDFPTRNHLGSFPRVFSLPMADFTFISVTQKQSLTSLHFLCHTFLNLFLKVFNLFVCVYMHVSAWVYMHVQMSSETRKGYLELQLWVSVSCTLWVLLCKPWLSGSYDWAARDLDYWAISPAPITLSRRGDVDVFKLLIKSRYCDTCIRKALCHLPFSASMTTTWKQDSQDTDCGLPRIV